MSPINPSQHCVQRTGGGVAPPEGVLPRKAESTLGVFSANTPPAANTCRWAVPCKTKKMQFQNHIIWENQHEY